MSLRDHLPLPEEREDGPLVLPWLAPCYPAGLVSFTRLAEWRKAVYDLSLHSAVPEIVRLKFERAQKVYFLGWIDVAVIKAAELEALAALELALKGSLRCRGARPQAGNRWPIRCTA